MSAQALGRKWLGISAMLLALAGCRSDVETFEIVRTQVREVPLVVTRVIEQTPEPFRNPHPILSDLRVRQALAFCTDKLGLIAAAYPWLPADEAAELVMESFVPRSHWAYAGDENIARYPFDPERGKALLEAAGWMLIGEPGHYRRNARGDVLALKLTTTTAALRQAWAKAWEEQMDECGIRILRFHTPASWFFGETTGLGRRDFELAAFAWVSDAEPVGRTVYACESIPSPGNDWEGQNTIGWCNRTASASIEAASAGLQRQERLDAYRSFQREFTRDMVSLPLFSRPQVYAYNPALQGFEPHAGESTYTWNASEWGIPGEDTVVLAFEAEPASLFQVAETAFVTRLALSLMNGMPYTTLEFGYQPRLQNELSTLENGLAALTETEVAEGDRVVDTAGDVVELRPGVHVWTASGEEREFTSGTLRMRQLQVTYEFVDSLTWSDGTPVSSVDYELYYAVACDPQSGAASYVHCDRVQAVSFSSKGYSITWLPGMQSATYFLAPFGIYPHHLELSDGRKLADVPAAEWGSLPEVELGLPISAGPYVLKEWVIGQRMVFEANPYFYAGPARTKTLVARFVERSDTLTLLQGGEVDIAGWDLLGEGLGDALWEAREQGKIHALLLPSATWEHVDMNLWLR